MSSTAKLEVLGSSAATLKVLGSSAAQVGGLGVVRGQVEGLGVVRGQVVEGLGVVRGQVGGLGVVRGQVEGLGVVRGQVVEGLGVIHGRLKVEGQSFNKFNGHFACPFEAFGTNKIKKSLLSIQSFCQFCTFEVGSPDIMFGLAFDLTFGDN